MFAVQQCSVLPRHWLLVCVLTLVLCVCVAVCAPAKLGYTLKANTNYQSGPGTAEGQIPRFEEAVEACSHTSNCVALNSYGYYIFGNASVVTYQPTSGLCVYVKNEGETQSLGSANTMVTHLLADLQKTFQKPHCNCADS